jgi:hypothetical protein
MLYPADPDHSPPSTRVGHTTELFSEVLGHLPGRSLGEASRVCKQWRRECLLRAKLGGGSSIEYPCISPARVDGATMVGPSNRAGLFEQADILVRPTAGHPYVHT